MVNISERPAEAATLAGRTTRFTMPVRIPCDRCADRVAALLAKKMETLPGFLRNSVTWDQEKEMARHAGSTIRTGSTSRKAPTCPCTPRTDLIE
jgi:transposase, IS30 family